jgi:hypothetical protein
LILRLVIKQLTQKRVRSYKNFSGAEIFRPLQPSFGAAVRRLWAMEGQRPFFHLEDDWIAKEPFSVEQVEDAFKSGVGAVTPLPEGFNISPEVIYSVRRMRYRSLAYPTGHVLLLNLELNLNSYYQILRLQAQRLWIRG